MTTPKQFSQAVLQLLSHVQPRGERMSENDERHAATLNIMRWFDNSHLPPPLAEVSQACAALANGMVHSMPDGPELTSGLRKLLEAKDCFVRAAVERDDERT